MQFGEGGREVGLHLMQRYNQNDRNDKCSQSLYERGAQQNVMRVHSGLAGVMDIIEITHVTAEIHNCLHTLDQGAVE